MIKWIVRSLFVVSVAAVTVILTLPLGVVVDQAAPRLAGLQWSQVQGTVWSGRISNLMYGRQLVGDVELRLRPARLLSGSLSYDISIAGPVAAGTANIHATPSLLSIAETNITVRIDQMIGLNKAVRRSGGTIQFRNIELEVDDALRCQRASGTLWTEALVKLGAEYGEELPELNGEIRCEADMLEIMLDGTSDSGVTVDLDARVGLSEASSLTARISGAQGEVAQALTALGFTVTNGDFVYERVLGP